MEELLELLELESIDEFEYFENFADLIEVEEEITEAMMHAFVSEVDKKVFAGLLADYFDDLLENLPDDAVELYALLNAIKASLLGLVKNADEDNNLVLLGEELLRFKNWYIFDSSVSCQETGSDEKQEVSVAEAIATNRCAKFDKKEYKYDFEKALDYPIDEYIVSLGDMIGEEFAEEAAEEDAYVPDGYCEEQEDFSDIL